MPDYGTQQVANNLLPLPSPGTNSLLQDSDSVLFYALDFWAAMITQYAGTRLMAAATSANVSAIASVVQQKYPYDIGPYLETVQDQFPLLSVWRVRTTYARKTAGWDHDRCIFGAMYALPPMSAGQAEDITPILRAVAATLRKLTSQGWDPSYTPPGGSAGQSPWGAAFAGLEEIAFTSDKYGNLPGVGALVFPAVILEGYWLERDMLPPAGPAGRVKFAGGDVTENFAAHDGTTVANVALISTQQAPTITSLSVTTGTMMGGTSVTLTGTLFLTNPLVLFGGAPASSVVWNSATSITCVTPPASGAGVVDVVVINRDNQVGRLTAAFTYT